MLCTRRKRCRHPRVAQLDLAKRRKGEAEPREEQRKQKKAAPLTDPREPQGDRKEPREGQVQPQGDRKEPREGQAQPQGDRREPRKGEAEPRKGQADPVFWCRGTTAADIRRLLGLPPVTCPAGTAPAR